MQLSDKELKDQLDIAFHYGQKRDYHSAIKILEPLALEYIGRLPLAMLYLARSYHALKNYTLAISAFHTYLALNPDDAAGWFFLGRTYLVTERASKAVECFSKSIKLNPESPEALGLLGSALLKQKKSDKALKAFEAALQLSPDDEKLNMGYRNALLIEAIHTYKNGNAELAFRMFEFLTDNGMQGVLLFLYKGHAARECGLLEIALESYKKAARISPDDEELKLYIVQVLLHLKRTSEAERFSGTKSQNLKELAMNALNKAILQGDYPDVVKLGRSYIKQYGDDYLVHNYMGEALRNLGKYKAAENHFKKALLDNPEYAASRYGLLLVYLTTENYEAILQELSKSEDEAPPIDKDTLEYYTVICHSRAGTKTENMLDKIQSVFKKHPKDQELMFILANEYLDNELPELAESWYLRLLESDTKAEQAYLNLITCYIQMENFKDAEKYYRIYLKKWKKNHKVHLAFIRLLLSRGKWAKAAEETEKLLPYVRNPLAIIRDAAAYRRKAGQYMKAAMHYRSLIASEPENADYVYQFVLCLVKEGRLANALDVIRKFHRIHQADETGMQIEAALYKRIESQN